MTRSPSAITHAGLPIYNIYIYTYIYIYISSVRSFLVIWVTVGGVGSPRANMVEITQRYIPENCLNNEQAHLNSGEISIQSL